MLVFLATGALIHSAPAARASGELCAATGSPFGPFDLQTYEAADYRYSYGHAMELAGYNQLFPQFPGFAVASLESGGRGAGSGQPGPAYIPPVLLKAIGWIESGWAQGSYDPLVQYGQVGPVLVSADCGYGIMQITSGMQNVSGIPNLEQAMTGSHFAFNIARGASLLADKWNLAPEARPLVGNRDPSIIENWYYALWGYNGFVYKNHPLNPAYDPARPPFSCGPDGDGLGHDRTKYPYQELILGCVAHPPMRGGVLLWQPQGISLPGLSDPAFAGPLSLSNWNACSYSQQCASMDLPTPGGHIDSTSVTVSRDQVLGLPALGVSQAQITLSY